MAKRFAVRPADGAVAGIVLGALVFALLLNIRSGAPSGIDRDLSAAVDTTTAASDQADDTTVTSPSTTEVHSADGTVETTAAISPAAGESNTKTTAVSEPSTVDAFIRLLRVEAEPPRIGYDRRLFNHWVTGADGCNVREQVLIAESLAPAQVDPYGCRVIAGDWISLYDGLTTDRPEDLEIDHVVALAEAWDSGAHAWDADRREAFANDVSEPGALIAVSSESNQSKSDHDPASWQPPNASARCHFATDWVNVKVEWGLSADHAEIDALRRILQTNCAGGQPVGSTR